MISTSLERGEISLSGEVYAALMDLRSWLFANVYRNPRSRQNEKAAGVVRALFEHFLAHPETDAFRPGESADRISDTADFVAGMTDRFAIATFERIFVPRGGDPALW